MMDTPNIRFKGFAEPWKQHKLGEITVKIGSGKTPLGGESTYIDNGIPLIRSQNVNNDRVDFNDVVFIDDAIDNSMANSRVYTNDVLLNITGASIGRSAVYKKLEHANVNQHVCIIRPINSYISDFIQLNLTSDNGQRQIESSQVGGGREGLNFQQIGKMQFMFPTKGEQERIGAYFNHLDYLITLHQRKCDEVSELKKFMLQKMFPKNGGQFPEIRFSGYSDPWEQRKLGEVVDVCSGRDYKHLDDGDVPVYGTGGYMLSVSEALSERDDAIGIGRKGTIDNPYILRAPFWTVDTLFYCIPKENYNLDFVYSIYQNINWKAMDESTGVPSLSKMAINNVDIIVPSKAEQEKIGAHFTQIDNLITLHRRKSEELKDIKKFMLQNMLPQKG